MIHQHFFRLFIILTVFLYTTHVYAVSEKVSIQLKWQHSFQFAGYYAAIEKGFYRDLGLEVILKEVDFSKDHVIQIVTGESEYGVSDSTLLTAHLHGQPVVLINQFFQHSPLVFLSHRDSGIISPYEMVGKNVIFNITNQGDAPLNALLLSTLGDLSKIHKKPFDQSYYDHFVRGDIDVISAYSTSQPYKLMQQGIEVNIINPQSYGIDYYGDNLFTSQKELEEHPERVKKISQASIKGWQYALDHPDEIIQIIQKKYAPSLSEDYLQYQARNTAQLIIPDLIRLGSVDPKRYQQVAEDYKRLGFTQSSRINNNFFYNLPVSDPTSINFSQNEKKWMKSHPVVFAGGSQDWAPFGFVDQNGQYKGIANDYLKLISEKTSLTFKISIDQWSNNLQKIKNKEIDLIGAAYFSEARSQYVNYSTPYLEILNYFFIRDDLDIKNLQDLNGKRVAIPRGNVEIEIIKKHFPKIQIIIVNNFGDAIDSVLENRADILFDSYATLTYALKNEGVSTIIPFKSTRQIGKNPIHMISRNDEPELASIIKKALNVITEKEKRFIHDKWLGSQDNHVIEKNSLNLTIEEQKWLEEHPVIKLGSEADWPPYEFIDQAGQLQGLSADIIRLVEQKIGVEFNIISKFSWSETLKKAQHHEIDMLSSIVKTEERKQFLSFTQAYLSPPTVIITHKDSTAVLNLNELKSKTVVVENQYYTHKLLAEKYPDIKLLLFNNTSDALKALSHGKADAYIGNQGSANWIAEQNALTNLKVDHDSGLDNAELRMAVRKDWPLFQSIMNKAIASITNMEMAGIRKKWLGTDSVSKKINLSKKEQQWLDEHKTIRFTGDPNWLPYEAFDKQGNYIGIVADHLNIIEQKLGIKLKIIPSKSWSESINQLKQGKIEVLSETSDSNLKSHLIFTQPYASSPIVIVMNKDTDYVENISQIKNKSIAVIKDYGYVPKIKNYYPEINFIPVSSIQEGLTSVSTGKVDAFLATLAQSTYHISDMGINNIRIVGKTQFSTDLAFGIRKDFAPLVVLFNRALSSIKQKEKQNIFNAWLKEPFTVRKDYRWLAKVIGILLLFMLVILYWNRKLASEINLRKIAEAQTQTLINQIPLQIIVTSSDGHILLANPRALADFHINKDEIDKYNLLEFYADINDRNKIVDVIAENGKIDQKIMMMKQPGGSLRSMMLSIMPINYYKQSALLTIAVDMTERLEFESALKKAKVAAETANKAKSDFLANMSHEIRTPMNAILGFTDLLSEQIQDTKLKSFVKTIQSAGKTLLTLINDILDLSKIEAGQLRIEKTACNPHTLLSKTGDIFSLSMREKNIDFIIEIDPIIPISLMLDEVRLRQVLFNLIGNAVKFTEKGFVKVKAYTKNENKVHSKLDLIIDIQDTGKGISEDQQSIVFQAFEQSSGQSVKKFGGTGLGLSISERLVKLMGGHILLNSQPGKGSTFTIKLINVPIASVASTKEAEDISSTSNIHISFSPGKILIVDDIADNRSLLLANFSDTKLIAVEAKNGLEAVKLAKQQSFDLILMDIRMPTMDGYQAAKEIKSFSDTPIIALTASIMTDEFKQEKSNNFQGYLRKPVLKKELMVKLSNFLPFTETIIESHHQESSLILSAEEQSQLPELLLQLKSLIPQCKIILNNNNISDIQNFSKTVFEIEQQFPTVILAEFVTDLNCYIDSFDIAEIKRSLNDYSQLVNQLEQLKITK